MARVQRGRRSEANRHQWIPASATPPVRTIARRPARSMSNCSANGRIGRVRGAKDNDLHRRRDLRQGRALRRAHPSSRPAAPSAAPHGRQRAPSQFERISWDDALDIDRRGLLKAEQQYGAEAVWPYYFAGTMGLVMRDGINRLRHAKHYSQMYSSICTTLAWTGFIAGTGRLAGPDPREMAKSDLVVIWGTNPGQHPGQRDDARGQGARKERGAKIVAIDIYRNGTMEQADIALCLRPGTDGALACAVMHVLFRDGYANWPYLEALHRLPARTRSASANRERRSGPRAITGLTVAEIEDFAR